MKSGWDKIQIILQPVGGLLTALSVAAVGFFGSQFLERRQTLDTNARLYAELMSKREEADSNLRKDMFNSIIGTFLKKPESAGFEEKLLNLELLSYNFHEALNLGPLFKHVYRQISESQKPSDVEYLSRLETAAREVTAKQVQVLEEVGRKVDAAIDFHALNENPAGIRVLEQTLGLNVRGAGGSDADAREREFRVDALYADPKRKQIRVKLEIKTPQRNQGGSNVEAESVDRIFTVGYFDFPMIDNIRLSNGQRCAIVLKTFQGSLDEGTAQITLVFFPGSRASLKEKPFYDEVIHDVLSAESLVSRDVNK